METLDKQIAAIDIGTTKIVAALGKVHRDAQGHVEKVEITSYGIAQSRGMKRGMINNMQEVITSIKDATKAAKFKENNVKSVYVGISGYTIRSTYVQRDKVIMSGKITQEDVETLINEVYKTSTKENEDILHVIPHNYIINDSYELPNPVGFEAEKLDGSFYMIIGDLKFINGIKTAINQAGFKTKKIIFEPLASAEAVLSSQEREGGVVLVDIGGGTTDIVIFKDNKLIYSNVIPFGGNSITEDIKTAFQCLKEQAEEIKVKYGSAIASSKMESNKITIEGIAGRPPKNINQYSLSIIIQARITEIIDTIDNLIKEFKAEGKIPVGITITGGGALLKDLDTLVKYRTSLDVRIASPIIANEDELNNPQYATTLGLLIKGDEFDKQLKETKEQEEDDDNQNSDDKTSKNKIFAAIQKFFKNLATDSDDEI